MTRKVHIQLLVKLIELKGECSHKAYYLLFHNLSDKRYVCDDCPINYRGNAYRCKRENIYNKSKEELAKYSKGEIVEALL